MGTLIVMDHTGDSRTTFDPKNAAEIATAEHRFKELTGLGFTPTVRTGPGELKLIRDFDPTAEEILFKPRVVGG